LEEYSKNHPEAVHYARIGLGFIRDEPSEEDIAKAREGMDLARKLSLEKDLLVLDEVNIALAKGLISISEMTDFITQRPPKLNLILTGRGCPPEIIELADTATEMGEIKHAYHAGIPARKGVDF
jgi:cob(I)alamin adenosyltransferase